MQAHLCNTLMCLYSNCFIDPIRSEETVRINWNTLNIQISDVRVLS